MRVSSLGAVRRSIRSHGCSCVFSVDASDPATRARTHRCRGSLPPPASSIATQHLRASWWIPRLRDPCADFIVRTFAAGCFGANCGGAVRVPGKRQRETARIAKISRASRCNDSKESFGKACFQTVFADAKKKNPRMGVRGRSRASEIGVTDLRKGISRGMCRCCAAGADCRNPSTARMRPHRDGSATFRTAWRCGRRVSSEGSTGIRGVPAALK